MGVDLHPQAVSPAGAARLRLIALCGLPGVGKTRLATALASALGARIVSRDEIRAQYFAGEPLNMGKQKAFDAMLALVHLQASRGGTLLMEGMPFSRQEEVERLEAAAVAGDAALEWLWLDAPRGVARKRIAGQAPGHPSPDRRVELVDDVAARFQPPPRARRLDANQPFPAVYRAALELLL